MPFITFLQNLVWMRNAKRCNGQGDTKTIFLPACLAMELVD
jgi:hypothetical protein